MLLFAILEFLCCVERHVSWILVSVSTFLQVVSHPASPLCVSASVIKHESSLSGTFFS